MFILKESSELTTFNNPSILPISILEKYENNPTFNSMIITSLEKGTLDIIELLFKQGNRSYVWSKIQIVQSNYIYTSIRDAVLHHLKMNRRILAFSSFENFSKFINFKNVEYIEIIKDED